MTLALVASLTVLSAGVVSVGTAAAHGDACGTNGIGSIVPDRGSNFDFHNACHVHDACYGGKWYGDSSNGRKACDQLFYSQMTQSCRSMHGWRWSWGKTLCNATASTYYRGVRWFGWTAF